MDKDPNYIAHRLLPDFVRKAASNQGIDIVSYSDDWVHVLQHGGKTRYVNGYRFDLNASAAAQNANDKAAASSLLAAADIAAMPHTLLIDDPTDFPLVMKPLHGTGGRGISLIRTIDEYQEWKEKNEGAARWVFSPLESIKREIRVIMLDERPLVAYEKMNPRQIPGGILVHNLGQGAAPQMVNDKAAVQIATQAMSCLGLRVASVDVIVTARGYAILEVNDGIMMEYFARHSDAYRQVAQEVYTQIVSAMFELENSTHAIL